MKSALPAPTAKVLGLRPHPSRVQLRSYCWHFRHVQRWPATIQALRLQWSSSASRLALVCFSRCRPRAQSVAERAFRWRRKQMPEERVQDRIVLNARARLRSNVHDCVRVDVGGDVTVAAAAAAAAAADDDDDDNDDDCDDNNNDNNNSDKNNHSDDVVCNRHKLKSKHIPHHHTLLCSSASCATSFSITNTVSQQLCSPNSSPIARGAALITPPLPCFYCAGCSLRGGLGKGRGEGEGGGVCTLQLTRELSRDGCFGRPRACARRCR